MNWIDGLIIFIFCYYLYIGVRRGFIEQTLEVFGFFITLFASYWIYRPVGEFLLTRTGMPEQLSGLAAFMLTWIVLQSLFSLILHFSYPLIPSKIRSAPINKYAGLIPSTIKATIIVAIFITLAVMIQVPNRLKQEIDSSMLGGRFVAQTSVVEGWINRVLGRDVEDLLTFLTVPAQTEQIVQPDETVNLGFFTTDVTTDLTSEQRMLELVNQERVKANLKPLVWDEQLAEVSRSNSRDMFARGYFSHKNPDGLSPFDRLERAGITYRFAGENLAFAQTVELAHNGLMRSPGHRANILSPEFGRIGIGVIDGGRYGRMFTQNFRNP